MTGKRQTTKVLRQSTARVMLADIARERYPDVPLSVLKLAEPTPADRLHKNQAEAQNPTLPYLEFANKGDRVRVARGLDTRFHIYTDDFIDPIYSDDAASPDGALIASLKEMYGNGPYSLTHIIAEFNPMSESIDDAAKRIYADTLEPRLKRTLEAKKALAYNAGVTEFVEDQAFPEFKAFEQTVRFQAGESAQVIAESDGITRQAVHKRVKEVLAIAGISPNRHPTGRPRKKRSHTVKVPWKLSTRT